MDEHEGWVERKIREAVEEGVFDDLPGKGRPIPDIDEPYDPAWWVRRWIRRHRDLDTAHEVAREVQRRLPRILARRDEAQVRADLAAVAADVEAANRAVHPDARLDPLPVDELLAAWRQRRHA